MMESQVWRNLKVIKSPLSRILTEWSLRLGYLIVFSDKQNYISQDFCPNFDY